MNHITPNPSESQQSYVTNWKDLPTETQDDLCVFSIYVAKRAGWTVTIDDDYISIESADGQHGKQFFNGHPLPGGIDQAWVMGYYHGTIPHYATDFNAILSHIPHTFIIRLDSAYNHTTGELRYYAATIQPAFMSFEYEGRGDTRALAICKAWLAWQDAKGGQSS